MPERLKVLVVTYGTPYPPRSGVSIRDYNLLKRIARSVNLFLCILATESSLPDLSELHAFCSKVIVVPARARRPFQILANSMRCWRAGYQLASHQFFYPELAREIRALVTEESIDILQVEHSFLVAYRKAIPASSRCLTILSMHNVGSRQYLRIAKTQSSPWARMSYWLKSFLITRMEAANAAQFDHCTVVSREEARLLEAAAPKAEISVVENGVDCATIRPLPPPATGNDLLFIGVIGYPPNADAVVYFCKSILPRIRSVIPDARLIVVGHTPPPKVRRLASSAVIVTGAVDDPAPYYQQCRACVVPLRAGGGTRLKILEAMAFGRPVVTTSIGCEGLDVVDGEHLLIGDTAEAFSENVINLLHHSELSERMSTAGQRLVEERYDWSVIASKLLDIYRALAARSPSFDGDAKSAG